MVITPKRSFFASSMLSCATVPKESLLDDLPNSYSGVQMLSMVHHVVCEIYDENY